MTAKNTVLANAASIGGEDKNYTVTVDGNKIITEVKWMDAVFFSSTDVTDEMKNFKFTVELKDDGTYLETDESKSVTKSIGLDGASMSYGGFKGKQISFSKTIGLGKNKETGETGVVSFTFNSEEFKKPVRDYLESCGWKKGKKGFFATLFGK